MTGRKHWLSERIRGSWAAGQAWEVAASVEEAEDDEVVYGSEAVRHPGEEPELGVDVFGRPFGEAVVTLATIPGPVLIYPVLELHQSGDLTSGGHDHPVEHGNSLDVSVLEDEP